ncbi:hypothetical protein WCE14_08955 [Acinetobacter schindleri]|uniref:hypothetical protein n=1 Tax=Acinetobacter schindleri TaxID=108981 RepID=UPI0034D5A75B
MKQTFIQTLQDYLQDGEAAQSLGAAMLQCNGMLVPEGAPEIALLIPNFSRPVVTNNESADYNLAGGGQFHTPGAPKNRYEGPIQIIETDTGQATAFAEFIMSSGGQVDAVMYDGRRGRFLAAHQITNVTFTFEPIDVDGEGVSAIQRVQGNIKYNYYGAMAQLGSSSQNGLMSGIANSTPLLDRARRLLDTVYAGNTLLNAMRDLI